MDLNERIAKLEEKVLGHENRLIKVEDSSEALIRLGVILDSVAKTQEEQQRINGEQHTTLVKMNENLDGLNKELKELSNRVDVIEKKDDRKKIDITELFKDVVFKVLPTLVGAWLLFKFGLK